MGGGRWSLLFQFYYYILMVAAFGSRTRSRKGHHVSPEPHEHPSYEGCRQLTGALVPSSRSCAASGFIFVSAWRAVVGMGVSWRLMVWSPTLRNPNRQVCCKQAARYPPSCGQGGRRVVRNMAFKPSSEDVLWGPSNHLRRLVLTPCVWRRARVGSSRACGNTYPHHGHRHSQRARQCIDGTNRRK